MAPKVASFELGPEQGKAQQQIQGALQAIVPPRPYDLADPMGLEVSVAERGAPWSLSDTDRWNAADSLGIWSMLHRHLQKTN